MFFSRVVVYHVTIVTSGHWEKFSAVSVMTGEKEVGSQVRTKLSYIIFFCKIYKYFEGRSLYCISQQFTQKKYISRVFLHVSKRVKSCFMKIRVSAMNR